MSGMQLIGITIAFAAIASFVFVWLPLRIFWANRERLSRWRDRHDIRPSLIHGWTAVAFGVISLLLMLFLPRGNVHVSNPIILIAMLTVIGWTAFGVDRVLHKPSAEYRPDWYVGEGEPIWKDITKERPKPTLSLTWVATATCVCCIVFARYGYLRKEHTAEKKRHANAVQAALERGATVKDGSVSFGGLTGIGDDDLTFLQDLDGIHDLNLSQTSITNQTLKRVAKMDSLLSLFLTDTDIDDEGLGYLVGNCPRLQILFLQNTKATGKVLPLELTEKPVPMRSLYMSGCPIDADGLENIAKLTQGGSYLELNDTAIDDSMLMTLKAVDVKQLMLRRTNLSKAGRDSLRASLPPQRRALLNWSPKRPASPTPVAID